MPLSIVEENAQCPLDISKNKAIAFPSGVGTFGGLPRSLHWENVPVPSRSTGCMAPAVPENCNQWRAPCSRSNPLPQPGSPQPVTDGTHRSCCTKRSQLCGTSQGSEPLRDQAGAGLRVRPRPHSAASFPILPWVPRYPCLLRAPSINLLKNPHRRLRF